jgi:DNA excision repair protein ERCC-2
MRIDIKAKRIEVSAQEFATFRPGPGAGASSSPWRAEAGRQWHETMRLQAATENAAWVFEQPSQCEISALGWKIIITGRTDQQCLTDGRLHIREIKTVITTLPRRPEFLQQRYAHHFLQLGTYCHGARFLPNIQEVVGELVFVDPTDGTKQTVALPASAESDLLKQAEVIAAHAENRRASHARLLNLPHRIPFKEPRPEWLQSCADLEQATLESRQRLMVAPTGFGKTSAALHHGLSLLRSGSVGRLLYVTGKGTGQLQVLSELRRLAPSTELRALVLRPRAEHEVDGMPDDIEEIRKNWARAAIDPQALLADGAELRRIREIGRIAGVPPWDITKAMLAHAEVIICDYNYVFSPRNRAALETIPGWNDGDTMLIVDEAHNLPERAAECLSIRDDANAAAIFAHTLLQCKAPEAWCQTTQAWADFLQRLPKADALSPDDRMEAMALAEKLASLGETFPLDTDSLPEPARNAVWNATLWLKRLEEADLGWLLWSPKPGQLSLDCLTAAKATGERLTAFSHFVLMTATPGPKGSLANECGIDPDLLHRTDALAPWRHGAYTVAIDGRVDTRLKTRDSHSNRTAIALIKLSNEGAVAAFFPSYKYAETIVAEIRRLHPEAAIALQPRGLGPDGTARFVEDALKPSVILCLILGGSLGEGVDMLGGKIRSAVVVGPALPEVNALQEARRKMFVEDGAEDPFALAYIRPGMRKVNQALGRLVRAPGHTARVLLHCRRFADESYKNLLSNEYGEPEIVTDDEGFNQWITKS